jgi:hypothetical protein
MNEDVVRGSCPPYDFGRRVSLVLHDPKGSHYKVARWQTIPLLRHVPSEVKGSEGSDPPEPLASAGGGVMNERAAANSPLRIRGVRGVTNDWQER